MVQGNSAHKVKGTAPGTDRALHKQPWLLLTKVLFSYDKLMAGIGGEQQPPGLACVEVLPFHCMLFKRDSVYRLLDVA